jgi:hypothetical protein
LQSRSQGKNVVAFGIEADSILSKYASSFEQTSLYLHLDKTIYTNNETIWFSAYIFPKGIDTFEHQVLYVKFMRNDNDSLIRSSAFAITNFHSYGNLQIPNTLPTGEYRLIAYTDKLINKKPSVIFQQMISVKTNVAPPFSIVIAPMDSLKGKKDTTFLMVKGTWRNTNPMDKVVCTYEIFSGNKKISKGKTTLDYRGEAVLPILSKQDEMQGTFITYPERESVPENIKEQLIVELYSK